MQAQAQVNTETTSNLSPNRDAKSSKLPAFVDEKDELDSYLLRFERYAEHAKWKKVTWAIKFSALLSGRAMDVNTRMFNEDTNDHDQLKKALLTRYNFTEDFYRQRFRDVKPEADETPDQFVV